MPDDYTPRQPGGQQVIDIPTAPLLKAALTSVGFEPVESGDFLGYENGIQISSSVVQHKSYPNAEMIVLSVKALHSQHFPDGINDIAVGIAETKEAALQHAVNTWVEGTFPVINEVFNDGEPNPQVRRIEIATKNLETGEMTTWLMYRGRVQALGIDPGAISRSASEEMNAEIMQAMANEIAGIFSEKRLIWLKCSIARQPLPDNSMDCDCWLNNENWDNGLKALIKLAETWPSSGDLQIRRQFFIFKPVVRSAAEATALFEKVIPLRKPWWRFGR